MNTSRYRSPLGLVVAVTVLAAALPALGDEPEPAPVTAGSKRTLKLVPRGHVYPLYVADPHRPIFALQQMGFSDTEIPDSGDSRWGLKLGSRFGILRIHPQDDPDRGLQISLDAGFVGYFDQDNSSDNVGWDGLYGLSIGYRPWNRTAFLLAVHHTSSHIGDEYIERTGRERIDYTREELVVGVSHDPGEAWTVYLEAATAYDRRNEELQERGRMQAGAQFESRYRFWKGRLGWHAAANGNAYEENDWGLDLAVQVGLYLKDRERTWRLGFEHYDGRALIGELFQFDETYTALTLWLDL